MRTIEVFADVLCPFAHAGLRTLIDARRERGRDQPRLRIRAWPLELINGTPLDPHHVGAEIVGLRASVCPDLFAGFSVDTFPKTSMPAFALAAAAARTGDAALIEDVGMALRNTVFEQGLDIGQPGVVATVADRYGLTALDPETTDAAVRADWQEGRSRGVIGSPHFFTSDGGSWFCPGLAISRDDAGNFIIARKEGNAAFADEVLGSLPR